MLTYCKIKSLKKKYYLYLSLIYKNLSSKWYNEILIEQSYLWKKAHTNPIVLNNLFKGDLLGFTIFY